MIDYYPLLAKFIAGLGKNSGEARRAIYDAARKTVLDEIRRAEPAMTEPEIMRERLNLEQAIRKVELDQLARRGRRE